MRIPKAMLVAAAAATVALAAPGTALAAVGGNSAPSHLTAPHSATRPAVTPDYELVLHPRVGCGGGDGTLQWGGNGSFLIPAYLSYDGNVYNYCSSGRVYMYLYYTLFGSQHNVDLGSAGPGQNNPVHFSQESDYATYGNIEVTACEEYNGWRCGKPTGPG